MPQRPLSLTHDRRILLLTLAGGTPAVALCLGGLWWTESAIAWQISLSVLLLFAWVGAAVATRNRVVRPLLTLSGLLSALREGDFSIQARGARRDDPLGEVMLELNGLIGLLREQRLGALEATALLQTVMEEINLAVFAFDDNQRLRLVNRAGERLLAQPMERLRGKTAQELGLIDCLEGESARTLQVTFPGGSGRWGMRRSTFRQRGEPHHLLVLADLSRALREEERQAWQRLLRVLGHELNNSLAPIKSLSASLREMVKNDQLPTDWKEDLEGGLNAISRRAESLSRFMESYSKLARLPQPKLEPVDLCALVQRVVELETRLRIEFTKGPNLTVEADVDQLEQLLINLLRNAVDAALETGEGVRIQCAMLASDAEILIEDGGPGIPNTSNLFVPFFTTKPTGTGIGLVLSRQIAEAHGGSLTLENRQDSQGCIARLRLPR